MLNKEDYNRIRKACEDKAKDCERKSQEQGNVNLGLGAFWMQEARAYRASLRCLEAEITLLV